MMKVMRRRFCALFLLALLALVPIGASVAFADPADTNLNNANITSEDENPDADDPSNVDGDKKKDAKDDEEGNVANGEKKNVENDGDGKDDENIVDNPDEKKTAEGDGEQDEVVADPEDEANTNITLEKEPQQVTNQPAKDVAADPGDGLQKDPDDGKGDTSNGTEVHTRDIKNTVGYDSKTNTFKAEGDIVLFLDNNEELELKSISVNGNLTIEGEKSLKVTDGITATKITLGNLKSTGTEKVKVSWPLSGKVADTNDKKQTIVDKDGEKASLIALNADADVFEVKFVNAGKTIETQEVLKGEYAEKPSKTPAAECTSSGWYSDDKALEELPITADTTFTWKAHKNLTHYDAVAATCTEEGNIEYWECDVCEKYFKDEAAQYPLEESAIVIQALGHKWSKWKVTTPATTKAAGEQQRECSSCKQVQKKVIPRLVEYTFSKGAKSTWTKKTTKDLELVVNRNYDDDKTYGLFSEVLLDGKTVDAKNYTAESGSLKLTMERTYLDTLAEKEHKVEVKFTDGSANTTLTVKPAQSSTTAAKSPSTGDFIQPGVIVIIAVITLAAAVAIIIARKRMA